MQERPTLPTASSFKKNIDASLPTNNPVTLSRVLERGQSRLRFTKNFCALKGEPSFSATVPHPSTRTSSTVNSKDFIWMLCRWKASFAVQTIPTWAGWQSQIDLVKLILLLTIWLQSVKHLLQVSQAAISEVGQEYTIATFDLAVAKKAFKSFSLALQRQNDLRMLLCA